LNLGAKISFEKYHALIYTAPSTQVAGMVAAAVDLAVVTAVDGAVVTAVDGAAVTAADGAALVSVSKLRHVFRPMLHSRDKSWEIW
jgi:hypothetical protein